jgi:hypothetical protein
MESFAAPVSALIVAARNTLPSLLAERAELKAENKRLRSYVTMQLTEPPFDYGDDISVEIAVDLAEARERIAELEQERDGMAAAIERLGVDSLAGEEKKP